MLLIKSALALIADDFGFLQIRHFTWIDDYERFEVQYTFEFAQSDVEQVADARRQSFEEPHVRTGTRQLDVSQALTADTRQRHFDAALIANYAAMLHALVLAAQTFPIG